VKWIETDSGPQSVISECLGEGESHIHGGRSNLCDSIWTEFVEEPIEAFGAFAFCPVDDLAGFVVGDESHVVVMLSVGDLIYSYHKEVLQALGSSSSATTRSQIIPTVRQAIQVSLVTVVLSILELDHAIRCSKSLVKRDSPTALANGTDSVITPCLRHRSLLGKQESQVWRTPMSRCLQRELMLRMS
jgi:hypothetical protein